MQAIDLAADLRLLTDAARASGKIACGFFKSDPQVWDKGGDAGPVTEADLAVNAMLLETLRAARPDYGWLSEETEDGTARLHTQTQFVVDPIDGTRAFIEGAAHWSHSLAIVSDGRPVVAAVYLPIKDLMFTATLGGGATLNGVPINVSQTDQLNGARVLSNKANFADKYWKNGAPDGVERTFRPSLAYRLALVAEGRHDAMITLRPTWEWDIAAGALLVTEAGGVVTEPGGAELQFNNPHPQVAGVVAGGPIAPLLRKHLLIPQP